jgi:hypothetical protein
VATEGATVPSARVDETTGEPFFTPDTVDRLQEILAARACHSAPYRGAGLRVCCVGGAAGIGRGARSMGQTRSDAPE